MTRVKNCWKRLEKGNFGPSCLSNKHGDLSFLLFFPKKDIGREYLIENEKNYQIFFFLLRNHFNRLKRENLNRRQHRFEPIRLFCLIAINPLEAKFHNNSIYKYNYASSRINKGDHCFLSWRNKTTHIKSTHMI